MLSLTWIAFSSTAYSSIYSGDKILSKSGNPIAFEDSKSIMILHRVASEVTNLAQLLLDWAVVIAVAKFLIYSDWDSKLNKKEV